jgi:DNA-binding HxlR family transcriptional regulator
VGPITKSVNQAVTSEDASNRSTGTAGARLSPQDERLFRDLLEQFAVLSEMCFRFSRDLYRRTAAPPEADIEGTIRRNLSIARHVFGEGLLDILAVVYLKQSIAFSDLSTILGGVSRPVLTRKLQVLESQGLIDRVDPRRRADSARFTLTHKGMIIARLGEPVFLYLRLAEGWSKSYVEEHLAAVRASARSDADEASTGV